ncbi:MAG: helix-turn-helix transcriptional regulator [Leptolyngbya sp. SIO1E4]|nr:helix-turn-helix transcriptional regulator [Leptolyngbya sp. SIO1E4]NER79083.1 helix-turn-helix transcriptional regulator [Leptolyngbya sp. SIO1D8]
MADREMDYRRVAELADLHPVTVNKLKNTYEMPPRLDRTTLEKLCRVLECQPGDLLRYIPEIVEETGEP